jgi:hypothetical protein
MDVMPSYPFSLAPGQPATQNIGSLQGYAGQANQNIRVLKYTILVDKDATAGTYNLKVNVHPQGSSAVIQQNVPIAITSQQNAEVIHIDRTALVPGRVSNITFVINNVGGAPLSDLTFSWSEPNGVVLPVGSDNTQYIKQIDIGRSATVQYQVIADTSASPGLYKLNLNLKYNDQLSGQQNVSTIAGVYVGGPTEFTIAPSDSGNAQTSFSVANTGSNPATAVSVTIPPQRGWIVTGSNSMIIGNLNKGDYTVASFNLQSTANMTGRGFNSSRTSGRSLSNGQENQAPEQQRLADEQFSANGAGQNRTGMPQPEVLVRIEYSDTTGTRQSVEQLVNVATLSGGGAAASRGARMGTGAVTTSQNPIITYKWYLLALALIAAGGFGHYKYKRRKLVDPNFKVKTMVGKRT